ncbi:MAG: CDP-alcohol phosphatidyltransferase family protein, partial [Planctomycetaceae bacterium]|nr:CDP-alcohol phosphatidyltransferase family protein [Planctomycetaceae bacterium]
MNWKLPNQLTLGRIVLAAVFFVLLGLYEQDTTWGPALLRVAFVLYIVAGITDVLDGYLARKMNLTSAFGRIADPFVDKVLVVGAFAMLAGSNYTMSGEASPAVGTMLDIGFVKLTAYTATLGFREANMPHWLHGDMASGVQAWMVVVILAREFIVSAVRGYSESCGIKFPATYAGKIKMLVQSVAICVVLEQLADFRNVEWAFWLKTAAVWLAVIVTVISGLAYVGKARKLLMEGAAGA